MSLFNQASLVVTPNGYKAGKLYSIKPTSGAGDFDVVRATGATRVNASGLIETVANNVPRLDYTGGGCPSILVEPQRTNLVLRSEEFDNASWEKISSTITANTTISPDGTQNADTLVITSGGYLLNEISGYSAVSGQSITISIFAKNQTTNFLAFGGATISGTDVYNIQDYSNGWYRHTVTRTFTSTSVGIIQFIIFNPVGTHIIWGAQVEEGAYATSYIPTVASAVTRNRDGIIKTGISSLIGQTEGTIFLDVKNTFDDSTLLLHIDDGTNDNRIILGSLATGANYFVIKSGIVESNEAGGTLPNKGRRKLALAYKDNDFAFYANGQQINLDASGLVPNTSVIRFAQNASNEVVEGGAFYNSIALLPTRLSNAELESLTTL